MAIVRLYRRFIAQSHCKTIKSDLLTQCKNFRSIIEIIKSQGFLHVMWCCARGIRFAAWRELQKSRVRHLSCIDTVKHGDNHPQSCTLRAGRNILYSIQDNTIIILATALQILFLDAEICRVSRLLFCPQDERCSDASTSTPDSEACFETRRNR